MVESILTAAEQALSEGLHTARMHDIAQRAGVAVGTLYNHFADRDALVAALIERHWNEMLDGVDHVLDANGLSFAERLRLLFEVTLSFIVKHRPFCSLDLHSGAAASKAPLLPALYARFETLVKRGVKEKALRAVGADLLPTLLLGTLQGAFLRLSLLGEKSTPLNPAELTRLFLEGAGQ